MNTHSLVLCTTPLQARIVAELSESGRLGPFDAIYMTYHNNRSHDYAHSLLSRQATRTLYLKVDASLPAVIRHASVLLRCIWWIRTKRYDGICLASFDNISWRYVVGKHRSARLVGFDDGTANITPGGLYETLRESRKSAFAASLLGIPSGEWVRNRVETHYSIYPEFDNVIPAEKISYVNVFKAPPRGETEREVRQKYVVFIGQPFHEYLSPKEVDGLRIWLAEEGVDFYLQHPRERAPILNDVEILNTQGQLAEDVILDLASQRDVVVLSGYSTVLFNLAGSGVLRRYISVKRGASEEARIRLVERTKADVVYVS